MTYYQIDKIQAFIIDFETFRPVSYAATQVEKDKGIWTYGYGFTRKIDGSRVREGDAISIDVADQMVERLINSLRMQLISSLGFTPPPNQLDCMTSLAYNGGPGAFPKLMSYLKGGDRRTAGLQMLDMIYQRDSKAIPRPIRGLMYRRASEFEMWVQGDYKRLDFIPEHTRSLMLYMNSFNQEACELLLSMEKVK